MSGRSFLFSFYCFVWVISLNCFAQDEPMSFPMGGVSVGVWQPMGFLSDRYGTFMHAGFQFQWLIKSKMLGGLDFNYGFTSKVKEDVLKNLKNEDGFIVNNEGNPADIRISGRSWNLLPYFLYKFPVLAVNVNSGLLTGIGLGYVEHRIKFLDYSQVVAALDHSLYKGYDRFSGGWIFRQTLGYLFIGSNRLTNFFFRIHCCQMLTKNYRGINYDLGQIDRDYRINFSFQPELTWMIPFYKKSAEGKYYTE